MTTESNNKTIKILLGIASVLLIALAIYTIRLYSDSKTTETSLINQKAEIVQDLEQLKSNYDQVIQDNELKDQNLLQARERIEILIDSVKNAQANVDLIRRYKIEIGKLKNERVLLFKKADSLIAANSLLAMQRDSTNVALNETIKVVDSVTQENQTLAETVKVASVVNAINLKGTAVVVRKSGKIVDTKRSSRADKIRACFTLTPNPIAKKGDRLLYVQVINPKNNLLGKKASQEFDGKTLNYSETTTVFYENEELDVCVLVNASEEDLVSGTYTINVFDGQKQVATTKLTLK
ncbi:MAG: hypothetical protein ACWA45_06710 [Flavobacteriales bacterium]